MAQPYRRSKKPKVSTEQAVAEAIFGGIGTFGAWIFRKLSGKQTGKVEESELQHLREHWETVEMHLLQPGTLAQAVSDADKIFDQAMRLFGVPGESMGERLKAAESRFAYDLYQSLWQAHKLRNALAHEVGSRTDETEAKQAVSAFRTALSQMGVL